MLKKFARSIVSEILARQVRRLYEKRDFTTIAVAGGIGKTSTKFAVADTLKSHKKVRFQKGNYNDLISVPLVFFGLPLPSLFNPFSWLATFLKIEYQLLRKYPYDVVIVEVGTDAPGQIKEFGKYLQIDTVILTALTPEHMVNFKDIEDVVQEELSITEFSKRLIYNYDLCPEEYVKSLGIDKKSYGKSSKADVCISEIKYKNDTANIQIDVSNKPWIKANITAVAVGEIYSAASAAIIADSFDIPTDDIRVSLSRISPVSGRMRRLAGIKNSLILDDTYNSSPEAVMAALDSIYAMVARQKIAILGNMNELGDVSESSHIRVGEYCSSDELDLVVTIGPDANKYIVEAAKKNGCKTKTFNNSVEAGKYVASILKEGAVVLAKGSQNGVFAEEAVKQLLADQKDAKLLVRQSKPWMSKKAKQK